MPVEYQEILEEKGDKLGSRFESKATHPAFAQISASNVSGGTYLYGSDFHHQNYVTIRIKRSEMNRDLSNDWPHAREEYIEVALSESQWAAFVSSMNRGEGVCCTLQHYQGKMIPQIPRIKSRIEQFRTEGSESADEAVRWIDELSKEIEESKLSQKQKDAWVQKLDLIKSRTTENLLFVAGQFAEHMEGVVNKAKTEISAFAHNMIVRTGIKALMKPEDDQKILGYEEKE